LVCGSTLHPNWWRSWAFHGQDEEMQVLYNKLNLESLQESMKESLKQSTTIPTNLGKNFGFFITCTLNQVLVFV
jgi:hypothetical protein